MEFIIQNEYIKVTVTTQGAQVKSVIRKCDGAEHMWSADPALWDFHAPVLFPHCGKVVDGIIEAKGERFEATIHGFVRLMEHELVEANEKRIVLKVESNEETRKKFPYDFCLYSIFTLENDTLHHTLKVENKDAEKLPFSIGYHPGFAVPFDQDHVATDYELRFSDLESPICINTQPTGLMHGDFYNMPANIKSIQVDENLFANESHCMVNLKSSTLGLYEKGTGRGVVCNIKDFPYVLLWSKKGMPRFVCIEPWHGLPSLENGTSKWEEKEHTAILEPGETWSTTLSTSFVR